MNDQGVQQKLEALRAEIGRLEGLVEAHRSEGEICCYHCGWANLEFLGSFQDLHRRFKIWQCWNCHQAQLGERMNQQKVMQLEARNPHYKPPARSEIERNVQKHGFIVELINAHTFGGRLLEIGCSLGFKLEAARRSGWHVQGVELSPSACAFVRNEFGIDIHQGTLETFLPRAPYEAIVAWHVLEHVPSISSFLAQVRLLLARDGRFIAQVPSFDRYRDLDPWNDYPEFFNPVHYWHFTLRSLRARHTEAGLTPVELIDDEHSKFLTVIATRSDQGPVE